MIDNLEDGDGFELEIGMKIEECQRRYNCGHDTVAYVLGFLADYYRMKNTSYKLLRSDGNYQMKLFDLDETTKTGVK